MTWRSLPIPCAALAAVTWLLFPAPGAALERDGGALPPADLPPSERAETAKPVEPLHPTAEEPQEPPGISPSLMEPPAGTFFDAWVDLPHAFIGRRIFDVVYGFDRFFADERDLDYLRPHSFIRWRNQVAVRQDGALEFKTDVRADVSLPYLKQRLRRLRILLESIGSGVATADPRAIAGQPDGGRADAVIQWTLLETLRSSIDIGGGLLVALPPGLVGRARFRLARPLGPVALARTAATGFWNTNDGFGFSASVALERALARRLLLSWTTGTVVTQVSSGQIHTDHAATGYQSSSSVALLATLGSTTALTVSGSFLGRSKPEPAVTAWRVATRLRSALFRRWIFGEVEPEVVWPLDDEEAWRPVPAVYFRLELQFQEEPPAARYKAAPPATTAVPAASGAAPPGVRCGIES